jgi:hypothetical protein
MTIDTLNIIHFKRLNIRYSGTNLKRLGLITKQFHSASNGIVVYDNVVKAKQEILQATRNKSGVYRWTNKVNGKSYIGSSVNLNARLSHYLSSNFLAKKILTSKSAIYNALLTYNYENFSLEILEYCDRSIVINREQYYLDKYEPEYNILTKAGSSLGFKHSEQTLSMFRSRKLSGEALSNLKKAKVGATLSPLAYANRLL